MRCLDCSPRKKQQQQQQQQNNNNNKNKTNNNNNNNKSFRVFPNHPNGANRSCNNVDHFELTGLKFEKSSCNANCLGSNLTEQQEVLLLRILPYIRVSNGRGIFAILSISIFFSSRI